MIRCEHVRFKTGSMTEHLCKDTGNVLEQSAAENINATSDKRLANLFKVRQIHITANEQQNNQQFCLEPWSLCRQLFHSGDGEPNVVVDFATRCFAQQCHRSGLHYPRGPHIEGLAAAPGEAKVSRTSGAAAVQLTAKWNRMTANKFRYLRQAITLTGFGTPTFSNALAAAQLLYDCFDHQFPEGTLEGWSSSQANVGDTECIDISNRYLTPQKDVQGQENMLFLKGVDPRNILQNMTRGDGSCTYVHTEDNQVHFFTAYRNITGDRKSVWLIFQDRHFELTLHWLGTTDSKLASHRYFDWEISSKPNCPLSSFL